MDDAESCMVLSLLKGGLDRTVTVVRFVQSVDVVVVGFFRIMHCFVFFSQRNWVLKVFSHKGIGF